MERKIGETFEFKGKTLQVKESSSSGCDGCYFDEQNIPCSKYVAGYCGFKFRTDKKKVIFEEVKEQPQGEQEKGQPQAEQQPQKMNLCEILKDCPEGTKLYSPLFGEVDFQRIRSDDENAIVITKGVIDASFTKEGFYYADVSEECLLFPSKEQRNWSKFTAPWLKKERFDPKTLKAFDKVLVNHDDIWKVDFFSHICQYEPNGWCQCIGDSYYICIPYNDETKHLVGTTEEAPEFYKYWED